MSKISIIDATVEQIISDIAYWEDIETSLRIMPTEDGGVYVESFGGDHCVRAETLREALIQFVRNSRYGKYRAFMNDNYHDLYGDTDRIDWVPLFEEWKREGHDPT